MKTKVEVNKIYRLLGNIEGIQEQLNRAIERKDLEEIKVISKYLDKVKKRIEDLVED